MVLLQKIIPQDGPLQWGHLTAARSRKLAKREQLFQRGDVGDALYGVISGRIKISISSARGQEISLSIMEPGDMFGEIALLDGKARTADATALTESELIVIRRDAFAATMDRFPALATHVVGVLCSRIRWISDLMEESTLLDLPAKLARRLLILVDRYGHSGEHGARDLTLSQSDLAEFLGVSRQVVNKHLQKWKNAGWIELGREKITVTDRRRIEEMSTAATFHL